MSKEARVSYHQIARALFLSVSTIETYRSRIRMKLGFESVTELASYAARWLKNEDQ